MSLRAKAAVVSIARHAERPSQYPDKAPHSVRILVADDHQVVRQGLRTILDREGFDIVGEAADGGEAVSLAMELQPDVIVMDIGMPVMTGIQAATEIRKSVPSARPILLTVHTEHGYVLEALRSGVRGYVLKSRASGELIEAIREILNGGMYLSPGIS